MQSELEDLKKRVAALEREKKNSAMGDHAMRVRNRLRKEEKATQESRGIERQNSNARRRAGL